MTLGHHRTCSAFFFFLGGGWQGEFVVTIILYKKINITFKIILKNIEEI